MGLPAGIVAAVGLQQQAERQINPEIASFLSVSEQTVCNDINAVLDKLNVSNRFEAAILAIKHKIQFHLPE